MTISIICFTELGLTLAKDIAKALIERQYRSNIYVKSAYMVETNVQAGVSEWAGEQFENRRALVFVGACGIAVRAIASFVKDKSKDSPVLVVDEAGQFVIPILSGHLGRANELAGLLADAIGATPVITTSTDVRGAFAVDVFASKNHLFIADKSGIARVSSKILAGKKVTLSTATIVQGSKPESVEIVSYPPDQSVDVVVAPMSFGKWKQSEERCRYNDMLSQALVLFPREYVIGIGCKKGKSAQEIECAVRSAMDYVGIEMSDIYAIASVDQKKEEEGIVSFGEKYRIPFYTYSADRLNGIEGDFSSSEFVKSRIGTDNVCERAAMMECGHLVLRKQATDGITVAIAKRMWGITFDE